MQRLSQNNIGMVVYVLITEASDKYTYFKIGITSDLVGRIQAVQTGCPYVIEDCIYYKCATRAQALQIERQMHRELSQYKTRGEWVRMDVKNLEHKRDFNSALERVLTENKSLPWKWKRISIKKLMSAIRQRDPVLECAEERIKMRQIHRLVAGRDY